MLNGVESAFLFADALGLLFIAIFVGSYIEFAGVNWIKNWLYIDDMSYIFISFGYSLIVLCGSVIYSFLNQIPVDPLMMVFILAGIVFYAVDTFWAQKRVKLDSQKAVIAANRYKEQYEKG